MICYQAGWVLPVTRAPIRNGWVVVDRGRVVAVGDEADPRRPAAREHLGEVALMPGLVNAHTHLELSHLLDRIPPSTDFVSWVRRVVRSRGEFDAGEVARGVMAGIADAIRSGTALVGDISNTLVSAAPLAASDLGGVVFSELIRFNAPDPRAIVDEAWQRLRSVPVSSRVRTSLAAHAPYSVAPGVFRAIQERLGDDPDARTSVHLAESAEEVRFLRGGDGPWRAFLEEVGAWDPGWNTPGRSPVDYLDACGFLGPRVLAVHGVHMTAQDLTRLASRGVTLVTCPRSNRYTGAGQSPVAAFYASGVRVAVGTDSLASGPDLNVFAELRALRALAPGVPASRLIESATREGAHALGFDADYGTIEPGKRARLLTVAVRGLVTDVEEYLVSGIRPDAIRWVEQG